MTIEQRVQPPPADIVSDDGGVVAMNSRITFTCLGACISALIWDGTEGPTGADLVGVGSVAFGVSADGTTVVGETATGTILELDFRAFAWDATHGLRLVEDLVTSAGIGLSGWVLERATGVSGDGRTLVGNGRNPLGEPEAWIVTLPEPSLSALHSSAAMALALMAWGRKVVSRAGAW